MQYLIEGDLPRIETLSELYKLLDTEASIIASAAASARSFYHTFEIPKRRGGSRVIDMPMPSLSEIQRRIHTKILARIIVSESAHGFVPGRSIVTNAKSHMNGKEFFVSDIQNFFPSVTTAMVINIFRTCGYNHDLATTLGLLCTLDGRLPQGAPTSPSVSNICCIELDKRLLQLAKGCSLTYTRYADDLTFSGDHIGLSLRDIVFRIIADEGFQAHPEKSLLARNRGKMIVTGISISRGELRVPRARKREIRKRAHFLVRNGIVVESARGTSFDPLYVDRVLGQLTFWIMVEPENPFPRRLKDQIVRSIPVRET